MSQCRSRLLSVIPVKLAENFRHAGHVSQFQRTQCESQVLCLEQGFPCLLGSTEVTVAAETRLGLPLALRTTIAYRHFPATRGIDIDRGPNLSDILLALHRDMIRPRRI